jgi:glycosyltransferase involved in cell wall biosynthesis
VAQSTQPPRICFILPAHWEAYLGGAQYQAKFIVEELVARGGVDIAYFAPIVPIDHQPEGYKITKISGTGRLRWLGYFTDAFDLYYLLRQFAPDVIYQRSASGHTGIAGWYARKRGSRLVWHIANDREFRPESVPLRHRLAPHRQIERLFIRYGVRHASRVIAQTEFQANALQKVFGRTADLVVPNFVPRAPEHIEKEAGFTVVWIANWKHSKRPEVLADIAEMLLDRADITFVMLGRVNLNQAWQRTLMNRIEAIPNIVCLGGVSQDEVNRWLTKAHLLINTSVVEGFSNTFIQAWLREVPVASLVVDPDRILSSGLFGACAEGDVGALSRKVVEFALDIEKTRYLGQQARRYAEQHHGLNNVDSVVSLLLDEVRVSRECTESRLKGSERR